MFGRGDHRGDAEPLLSRVGLAGQADRPAAKLTYIDQKRLELARALALQPRLLLLDEWLAGLNPSELVQGVALIRALRGTGITIVMVEHVMDAIRSLCDRCVVMNAGAKIDGATIKIIFIDIIKADAVNGSVINDSMLIFCAYIWLEVKVVLCLGWS